MRRIVFVLLTVMAGSAARAEAVTVRDVIELSKAGLSEPVLLALIDVDRSVFSIDTETLKQLRAGGVSDAVIVAMIHSGRDQSPMQEAAPEPPPSPLPVPEPATVMPESAPESAPEPVAPAPIAAPAFVPIAVPYLIAVPVRRHNGLRSHAATRAANPALSQSVAPVRVNCVVTPPVYWGFGGKLRPGSWQPTPVCK